MNPNQGKSMGCFTRGCLFFSLHTVWIILLGVGLYYGFNSFRLTTSGVETSATIIAFDTNSSDGVTTYSPIYEYTFQGETYRYNSVNSSNLGNEKIGDRTTLLVDPTNPKNARENSFWELWLLPAIMLPISLGLAVMMLFLQVIVSRFGRVTSMGSIQINP